MQFQKSLTQAVGKPVDTDRTRSLQGDHFDVTGFVEVEEVAATETAAASVPGRIHYSFKGPALVGQSLAQNATQNTLPAQAGMVDVDFPCRFTERPLFTYGFEHAENASVDALTPMVASVVSWRQGRRDETGLAYYDGARVLITAPSVAGAIAGGIAAARFANNNQTVPPNNRPPTYPAKTKVNNLSADGLTMSGLTIVNGDGVLDRIEFSAAGLYQVTWQCHWSSTDDPHQVRELNIYSSGDQPSDGCGSIVYANWNDSDGPEFVHLGDTTHTAGPGLYQLVPGDYLEFWMKNLYSDNAVAKDDVATNQISIVRLA